MTDMTFGFQREAIAADALSWPERAGQAGDVTGPLSLNPGRRSRIGVAPDWTERLVAFLRRMHPTKTAECVAARCRDQVSAEQVRKWLTRGSAPSGTALLWLATAYGPALLVHLFGPSPIAGPDMRWLDVAARAEKVEELGERMMALRAELDLELARSRR